MQVKELLLLLEANEWSNLHITLPYGFIPPHFHVTEVGKVHKTFVDCGGTRREEVSCVLQVWTADDVKHRLLAGKLAKILKVGKDVLGSDELPVEIEYGKDVAARYVLANATTTSGFVLLNLTGKQTDCLAPDKCGVSKCCGGKPC